jgi:hypothetical protein
MVDEVFRAYTEELIKGLNERVFGVVYRALQQEPALRATLNPAFPFPQQVRIGFLPSHLVVEYVGPEDDSSENFKGSVDASHRTVLEFLGIGIGHLDTPKILAPPVLENLQVFMGEAMELLDNYQYGFVGNPNDVLLNGFPDFTSAAELTYVSNVTFLWSDPQGDLRVRRVDFMELFPVRPGGWPHRSEKGLDQLAQLLIRHHVPRYEVELHRILNEFIALVGRADIPEPEITRFLSANPEILQLAFGAHAVNPQIQLKWQYKTEKPNLQPDFLPTRMDGYADILEFKLPHINHPPLVGPSVRRHPSFEIDSAIAQVDEYSEWCGQEVNRRWLEKTHGIKIHEPRTYLVLGHSKDFSAEDRRRLGARRNVTVFTYDEFIAMARMQLYRVK